MMVTMMLLVQAFGRVSDIFGADGDELCGDDGAGGIHKRFLQVLILNICCCYLFTDDRSIRNLCELLMVHVDCAEEKVLNR